MLTSYLRKDLSSLGVNSFITPHLVPVSLLIKRRQCVYRGEVRGQTKMARANTYEMEKGGFSFEDKCECCSGKPIYRAFYYPTYMNGDAEWLGDFCEEHKGIDMTKLKAKEN